jgi:hypothetical protein
MNTIIVGRICTTVGITEHRVMALPLDVADIYPPLPSYEKYGTPHPGPISLIARAGCVPAGGD